MFGSSTFNVERFKVVARHAVLWASTVVMGKKGK
jgi:hypothetical protein